MQIDLSAPLSIVLPPEEDELISSWLDRIARFYGVPAWELFGLTRGRRVLSLSKVDLGTSELALTVIATRLGITSRQLAIYTIAGAYPWAVKLVALAPQKPTRGWPQRIRYAACPICLEHQKVERGFSWLRREWVLAARTVCLLHNDFLLGCDEGPIVHPAWSNFARVHRNVQQPTTPATRSTTIAVALSKPGSLTSIQPFHRTIATVEETTLLLLARRRGRGGTLQPHNAEEEFALRVQDLIWAFTRSDDLYGDRIVYDAVACNRLDDAWHISRRRHPGPLNFNGLSFKFRHLLVVTATLLLGPRPQLEAFYGYATSLEDELGVITRRLDAADRHGLTQRLMKWSTAGSS